MSAPPDEKELGLRNIVGKGVVPAQVQRRIVLRAIERIEPRAHRPVRWVYATVGLVAAVALVVAGWFGRGPPRPSAGSLVATTSSAATYAIGPHRVELLPLSRMRFAHIDPGAVELELQSGRANFQVAHLLPAEHFKVQSEGVLVEVVGTRFAVEIEGPCQKVRVQEGQVRVTSRGPEGSAVLLPGQERTWCPKASGPEALTAEERLVREALALIRGDESDLPKAAALLERYRIEYADGVFEEEVLFYLCLTRDRLGQTEEAHRLKELFWAKFPGSGRGEKLRQQR